MPVDTQHPQYEKSIRKWCKVRDCVDGSDAVKAKKQEYLPKPNPDDDSEENKNRYADYLMRANYVNFTGMTLEGLMGMVFRRPVASEVQKAIEYLKENSNGAGLTLDQMARRLTSGILQTGRAGLLVDYPEAPEGLTAAEVAKMNLRANILHYRAEDVINWKTEVQGGISKLSLVVLRELEEEAEEDSFETEIEKHYRVLRLVDSYYLAVMLDDVKLVDSFDGKIYIQEVYNEKHELKRLSIPRKADKSYWNEIPFIFVGAQNNDPDVDKSPLYDIAEVNLAHYRNSADFEESSYMVGQPTAYASGLNQTWVSEVMKGGVILGSRSFLLLPEGGEAGLLQANQNQMPERGMVMKEAQIINLGARIIQDQKGNETAEAAKIRYAGQNSKLGIVIGNIESALLKCFEWTMWFMGTDGDNTIDINKDFYDKKLDPQLVMAQIQMLDRGLIAKSDFRDNMRDGGLIDKDRTDEQIDAEAEEGVL